MPRVFEKDKFAKETAGIPFSGNIFEVHVVDGSYSMVGPKFRTAVAGVNADLLSSKEAAKTTGVGGTCSVYQFSTNLKMTSDGNFSLLNILDFKVYTPNFIGQSTYLYSSLITIIKKYIALKNTEDKVLLKISTDGRDMSSDQPDECANLIKEAQENHGFTITFMGTEKDIAFITKSLNIDGSNTVKHENTAKSMEKSFNSMKSSSVNYRSAVKRGEDVTYGFYGKQTD